MGDALVAVETRTVKGLSLKVVKAMIEGPTGSVVQLLLQRPTGEKYEVRAVRTLRLAEDIQLATYGELLTFLRAPLGADFFHQSTRDGEPQHELKATHDELCDKMKELKEKALGDNSEARLQIVQQQLAETIGERDDLARKLDENFREGEKIIKDLRDTLTSLDAKNQLLQAELDVVRSKEMAAMTIGLRSDEGPPAEPSERKQLEVRLEREIGGVLNVEPERVEVIGLHKGSLKADVTLLPDPSRQGPTAKQLADALNMQMADAASPLRRSPLLRDTEFIDVKDPHDWIVRLRATVETMQHEKARLAQDLVAAQKDLEATALHKDQRFSHTLQQLQDRERELQRMSREVDSQSEARKLQLESAMAQRNLEESRLRGSVKELTNELEEQEAVARGMRTEVERYQAELQQASAEVRRLEGEVERGRTREAQLQSDAVLLNQKHQQTLSVTEKALDDANETIAVQKQGLAEMDQLQRRCGAAEEALRAQTAAFEDMKGQMKAQLDFTQTQADNEKMALANQYATERREFVGHLESAEGTVRSLQTEHEQRLRQQADLVKKLASQEEMNASLTAQLQDAENQVGLVGTATLTTYELPIASRGWVCSRVWLRCVR